MHALLATSLPAVALVGELAPRLGLDLACAAVLAGAMAWRRDADAEFVASCALLNLVTFALASLLNRVPVNIGFALGLFAIFGILRYRTHPVGTLAMTWLFVSIGLAVVNGVEHDTIPLWEVVAVDAVILLAAAAAAVAVPIAVALRTVTVNVGLEDASAARRAALTAELSERLGAPVRALHVKKVDLGAGTAVLEAELEGAPAPR
jgi:hypothetical protein